MPTSKKTKHVTSKIYMPFWDGKRPRIASVELNAHKSEVNIKCGFKAESRVLGISDTSRDVCEDIVFSTIHKGQKISSNRWIASVDCKSEMTCHISTNLDQCDQSNKACFIKAIHKKFTLNELFPVFSQHLQEYVDKKNDKIIARYDIKTTLIADNNIIDTLILKDSEVLSCIEAPLLEDHIKSINEKFNEYVSHHLSPVSQSKQLYSLRLAPTYFSDALRAGHRSNDEAAQNQIKDAEKKLLQEYHLMDENGNYSENAYDYAPGTRCVML